MKLNISSLKFDADEKLLDFIQKKTEKLDTFYDKIIDGEANLKLDKNEAKENKIIDLKVNIPGATLFASEQKASFEAATDEAVESIRRQLKKHKGKFESK